MVELPRVKICGITRREDALLVDEAGADYLGVVLSAGFGRSVGASDAARIVEGTHARKVAVLVDESADGAEAAARALGAAVIQLHGAEDPGLLEELRERGPWKLWKAVRARSLEEVAETVQRYAPVADGLLVEGWKEGSLGVGGARLRLDAESVRDLVPPALDFVLAGGLDPKSVGDATRRFHPDVVDVSSGVERELGVKDPARVRAFVRAARGRSARASAARGAR